MPQSLISKLGLDLKSYKKYKKKPYSNVQFNYNGIEEFGEESQSEYDCNQFSHVEEATTGHGHKITDVPDEKLNEMNKKNVEIADVDEADQLGDDKADLEEWERHEALHDDVTKQDRTSPYFFEKEIELQWEKGGSGLVFYTVCYWFIMTIL